MAKRKGRAGKVDLVSEAKATDPEPLRIMRKMEAAAASAKARAKLAEKKLEQAEAELEDIHAREELLLATKDQIKEHKLRGFRRTKGRKPPATAVICCNDWHAEASVDPNTVNGLNEFNLEICERRIHRTWEKAIYLIDFQRNVADIRDAVLWVGGDMISGTIHEELEESNFLGPTEAIIFVQQKITDGIRYLFKELGIERMHVVCSHGNHGRSVKRKRIATSYRHSWEWLAYNQLASYFANDPRVTFQVPCGYHAFVDIQGWTVRFHHGDSIRYQGGVGGISIPVNKALAQWNKSKHASFDIFGHWHQYLDTYTWTSCGCLVGYDAFALSIKADFQKPTQTLIMFDKEHGKTAALPIFVE